MGFVISIPSHEQDAFNETLDQTVTEHTTALEAAGTPMNANDALLLDYLTRKAKQIMEDAPIVATHLVATISGHANDGGNVAGVGSPVSFAIIVNTAAEAPQEVPVQQQPQTTAVHGIDPVPPAVVPPAETGAATSPAPADPAVASASGQPIVPTQAQPSVPSTEDEAAEQATEGDVVPAVAEPPADPSVAPVEPSAVPADVPVTPTPADPSADPNASAGGLPATEPPPVV